MATYTELHIIFSAATAEHEALLHKVEVAIVEAARIISAGEDSADPPWDQTAGTHDDRVRWAGIAVSQTGRVAQDMFKLLLAQNKDLSVSTILGASDTAVQNNVNQMVDVMAKALALS